MDLIQINKFSNLHDGSKIIFCKTDFIKEEFNHIKKLDNEVILITGNSDYPITDELIRILPKNISEWYAQNAISMLCDRLIPIPMGIENKLPSIRDKHGIGYFERVELKERLLNKYDTSIKPTKWVYANFDIRTNFHYRNQVKEICEKSPHIDWESPNLSLEQFFNRVLDYEMIVCPIGNGVDTHRIWEVLYSNRIPITIKVGEFKIYELYKNLPIIILDDINQLGDNNLIKDKYSIIKNNIYNYDIMFYDYWEKKIKKI